MYNFRKCTFTYRLLLVITDNYLGPPTVVYSQSS